jgi:folate-binding protein YgfZ
MVSRSTLEQLGHYDIWGDYLPNANESGTENSSVNSDKDTTDLIKTCWLNQFSALKIYGPDAERFLQGQLTCNLSDITNANSKIVHYGACCTAKGRVVANFNISFDGESYWLVLPTKSADILDKHLQKYKVFFKATIDNCKNSHLILGQWHNTEATDIGNSDKDSSQKIIISDRRQLLIIEDNMSEEQPFSFAPTLDWQLANIADGIYFVDNDQHEQWIPQHINWHKLDGISFSKGCYTGQEIVARLQYLGKVKKALYHYSANFEPVALEQDTTLNEKATPLFDGQGKKQGETVLQRNGEILAVLNGENPDTCLYLTDSKEFPLTLQNLPYTDKKEV